MYSFVVSEVLTWTGCIVGVELAVFAYLLIKRQLFHWLSSGFWSWTAFALYFVVSPLSVIVSGKTVSYEIWLELAGGTERAVWICVVVVLAILFFFLVYLHTPLRITNQRTKNNKVILKSPGFYLWILIFLGFGCYSLISTRAGLASWGGETSIVSGRFTGDITGYQHSGYMFMVYPTILLLLWPRRNIRVLGLLLGGVFLALSVVDAWSRYATVSVVLAIIMTLLLRYRRNWPSVLIILVLLSLVLIYQARGHEEWRLSNLGENIAASWVEVQQKGISALAESDTAMLKTLWVESYISDRWRGYSYGIPFINYVTFGWIPGRLFPGKYFMIEWLNGTKSASIMYPPIYDQVLYGAKSTLIGSFYKNGGIIAVLLEMMIAGWLCRRLDGMLDLRSSKASRALGVCWLSILWMVWGSSDTWGLMTLGVLGIPYFAGISLFFTSPKVATVRDTICSECR